MATSYIEQEIFEDRQLDYQLLLAPKLSHNSFNRANADLNAEDDKNASNFKEIDLSRDSLLEERDADDEESKEWCNVFCSLVRGRLRDGRSECIRWCSDWVSPIEFEDKGGKG